MGLPFGLLQPMKHMYANLNRYWKLGKTAIGAPWRATNGVLQGCGVSVVLLNSMVTLWLRAVSMEVPSAASAVPGGYADDIRGTANKPAAVQQIVDITDSYAALSGQELNADKCFVFAVSLPQRKKSTTSSCMAKNSRSRATSICLVSPLQWITPKQVLPEQELVQTNGPGKPKLVFNGCDMLLWILNVVKLWLVLVHYLH